MRINILIAGGVILAVSILLFSSLVLASVFGLTLGSLNLITGIVTTRGTGIAVPADGQGPLRLLLDKGVIRTRIYTIAFSGKKLVLRKLGSANLTVLTALLLAVSGAALAGPFGIVAGGITAFSLQEFVTQRRRDRIIKGNPLEPSGRGDIELSYDDLDKIQLLGSSIHIYFKNRIVRIAISRRYSKIIGDVLEKVIPSKVRSGSVPSGKAP